MTLLVLAVVVAVLAAGAITAMKILSKVIMMGIWVVILLVLAAFIFGDRLGLPQGLRWQGHSLTHNTRGGR